MRGSLHETVAATLRGLPAPVFFAGVNTSMSRLTVHVHAGCDVAALKAQVASAVQKAGETLEVTVRAHRLGQLAFPRSLEQWLAHFKVGERVLHDPTMIVSHARRLLAAAKSCRTALGNDIAGSFFDSDRRTLFVLARKGCAPMLQPGVAAIVAGAYAPGLGVGSSPVNVQVVEDLPRRGLVPVDARSASLLRRIARTVRRWLAPAAVALAISGAPAAASINPVQVGPAAVSARVAGAPSHSEFGVLSGLSVLTEGQRYDAFAATTLKWFFGGTGQGAAIHLAQSKKLDECFDSKGKPVSADCVPFYTGS
jgi:hypothetical protein